VQEEVKREQMDGVESSRGSAGLYKPRWVWSRVLREWKRLGVAGSSLGRRCELSAALGVAASGVHWFGHGTVGFRALARETVRGTVNWVG
jgi:hypothetical protein